MRLIPGVVRLQDDNRIEEGTEKNAAQNPPLSGSKQGKAEEKDDIEEPTPKKPPSKEVEDDEIKDPGPEIIEVDSGKSIESIESQSYSVHAGDTDTADAENEATLGNGT